MRTPLSSGLAAASLGLLLLGLAARTWQIVLLALPPIIVLAFGSIAPAVKGDFVLGPVRARSFDPLALGSQDAVVDLRSPLVVAPPMEDLRRATLQPRRTRPWFGQVPSRRIGAGTDFWGVREYVAGDEVRR